MKDFGGLLSFTCLLSSCDNTHHRVFTESSRCLWSAL